ncbi:hypothetical protein NM208_g14927 [Fusarium decemcellulare]|uniref:Uncharacterized protein n=1 Tax=Fusarium decemcellulare TaxID=57161 RepID=A0ACC1RH27_9HYPO|nr:hypothetical protein NM208_g14927 [Fusarium decemcellulare]
MQTLLATPDDEFQAISDGGRVPSPPDPSPNQGSLASRRRFGPSLAANPCKSLQLPNTPVSAHRNHKRQLTPAATLTAVSGGSFIGIRGSRWDPSPAARQALRTIKPAGSLVAQRLTSASSIFQPNSRLLLPNDPRLRFGLILHRRPSFYTSLLKPLLYITACLLLESSFSQPSMAPNTSGIFSFYQTEPSADLLSGSSWATTAEGPQNFQDFSDNGSAHSGEAEEFIYTSGQTTPRGTRVHSQGRQDIQTNWTAPRTTAPSVTQGGQAMSRVSSSRSSGSSLSQSSHLSNMDFTGNASALQTGTQTGAAMAGMDTCLLDSDADGISPQMYWPPYSLDLNGDATFSLPDASPLHVVPAHMQLGPDVSLAENSPPSPWDCFSSSISRSSSPNTIEDIWFTQSPNSSPQIQCQSPSLDRNIPLMSEDANGKVMPQIEDPLALPAPFTGPRRQNSEGESARDHDLYKKAAPLEDGLYHCPWEGQSSCNHKPEKLKCNYE